MWCLVIFAADNKFGNCIGKFRSRKPTEEDLSRIEEKIQGMNHFESRPVILNLIPIRKNYYRSSKKKTSRKYHKSKTENK